MKKQKGQGIIEFAVVLPIFLLLLFGTIYCGMLFYDYSTLSNIARTSTREAAIILNTPAGGRYTDIENYYKVRTNQLLTRLYLPAEEDVLKIQQDSNQYITTTITMKLPEETSYLMRLVLPAEYRVVYLMRKENI